MTKQKSTKRALLLSALSLLMCVSMLIGSTFAWFTDSVTSGNNKIVAGNLDIELEYYNGTAWKTVNNATDLFTGNLWEPGHTEVVYLKLSNLGSLALKYQLGININSETLGTNVAGEPFKLSDYIYMGVVEGKKPSYTDRETAVAAVTGNCGIIGNGYTKAGTMTADAEDLYLAVVVYMPETVGNEANYLAGTAAPEISLGINLIATQLTHEEDGFNNEYDKEAALNFTPVSSFDQLKTALANKEENILLTTNIEADESVVVDYAVTISGGKTISRANGFTGDVFTVKANASLTLENVVVDGGAVWVSTLADGAVSNGGVVATGTLITAEANAQIILNKGAVLQNNDGAFAVNLGTRIGASLTMNGGWIINNRSSAGAVWGGGNITINEGSKINNNCSTGLAGAIRMVGSCNLTMNGGEISGNTATTDGGAIWGYGSSTYTLNGGEISGNTAGGVGGGIYLGTYSSVYISDDFKMCNNTATNSGAIRFTDHTSLYMSGGEISGNHSTDNANYNGFYGWNTYIEITGGTLADDFTIQTGLTPAIGAGNVTGTVHFAVKTNHNTVTLKADFGTFKFTVAEGENIAAFNFKPAADYTYTEGDEAKLICLNEGYKTYWDAASGTFRLQATA